MSICEKIRREPGYLIITLLCVACGITVGVFSIFHWIDFVNTAGTYVVLPGLIGLLRVVFESSYSWVKQDLFWLSIFTTTIAYSFLFIPYIFAIITDDDWVEFISTDRTNGFIKALAWVINIIYYLLTCVASLTLILSILGSGVLTILYILRYKDNVLVSSIISKNTAIVEMIFVAPFTITLAVILINRKLAS